MSWKKVDSPFTFLITNYPQASVIVNGSRSDRNVKGIIIEEEEPKLPYTQMMSRYICLISQ